MSLHACLTSATTSFRSVPALPESIRNHWGYSALNQFRTGLRLLRQHFPALIVFELLWKLLTVLIIAPTLGGLVQAAIRAAHLRYLTNSNLLQFLRSPWTLLLLAVLLVLAALYTLFEIAAVCACFAQPARQPMRKTLRHMIRAGIRSLRRFFTHGSPLLLFHLLVLIPLMQFSAASGIFAVMGIPDFISYYLTKKEFLLPIYLTAIVLCCLLSVRWIFSSVLFVRSRCKFRSARKCSASLVKGRFWRTFLSVLVWNLCYFGVLLALLAVILLLALLAMHIIHGSSFIPSRALQVLKLLVQLVLWTFSFFSTPICMAHLMALLQKRRAQCPDVAFPEPEPATRKAATPFRRRTILISAVCCATAALVLNFSFVYSLVADRSTLQLTLFQKPSVTAHRGLSAHAPENTLYAFSDAINAGANLIELDVQQTKDGVLVVMHDSSLRRTTGDKRSIWEVDYDEIADLDAGSWFDPAYANARISTLEDVLRFVGGKVQLNIEIKPTKHNTDDLEQNVADLIAQYGYEDKCWVTSFSYTSLKKVKQANPDIRTGYIMSVAYGRFYTLKYADAFSLNKVFITRQVVNSAHQAGKQVFAWTVNSTSEVRSLCNLHVDSIITDDPVMAQQVIARNNSSETLRTILDYLVN